MRPAAKDRPVPHTMTLVFAWRGLTTPVVAIHQPIGWNGHALRSPGGLPCTSVVPTAIIQSKWSMPIPLPICLPVLRQQFQPDQRRNGVLRPGGSKNDRAFRASGERRRGHFGTVWKARDTKLDRTVAVNIPCRGQIAGPDAEMFIREAARRHRSSIRAWWACTRWAAKATPVHRQRLHRRLQPETLALRPPIDAARSGRTLRENCRGPARGPRGGRDPPRPEAR